MAGRPRRRARLNAKSRARLIGEQEAIGGSRRFKPPRYSIWVLRDVASEKKHPGTFLVFSNHPALHELRPRGLHPRHADYNKIGWFAAHSQDQAEQVLGAMTATLHFYETFEDGEIPTYDVTVYVGGDPGTPLGGQFRQSLNEVIRGYGELG